MLRRSRWSWTPASHAGGHGFKSRTEYMENTYESRYPDLAYECGAGWDELIDKCVDKMLKADPTVNFLQIKEKFGGLRIYYSHSGNVGNLLDDYIADAEDEAEKTCMLCGSTDYVALLNDGWLRTVCKQCEKNKEAGLFYYGRLGWMNKEDYDEYCKKYYADK